MTAALSSIEGAPRAHRSIADARSFDCLLAPIQQSAAYFLRKLPKLRREELMADVVATAYVAFARLIERGLESMIYPTVLAKYAVRQVLTGRRVGTRRSARDVLSPYAQAKKRFLVEPLEARVSGARWQERLLCDRRATPADLVACKLDFAAWLLRLAPVKRRVALQLAIGNTASEVATHFRMSRARISQIRRQLKVEWNVFQGLPAAA